MAEFTHPADQRAEAARIESSQVDGPEATRAEDDNPLEHKGEPIEDDYDRELREAQERAEAPEDE